MFEKSVLILVLIIMTIGISACGQKMPNPMLNCLTADELNEKGGVPINTPKDAKNIHYSFIEPKIEQVTFTFEENEYCYRAEKTRAKRITGKNENLAETIPTCTNVGAALAGMYFEWETLGKTKILNYKAVHGINHGNAGMIAWLEGENLYSLSVNQNASKQLLKETARSCKGK